MWLVGGVVSYCMNEQMYLYGYSHQLIRGMVFLVPGLSVHVEYHSGFR